MTDPLTHLIADPSNRAAAAQLAGQVVGSPEVRAAAAPIIKRTGERFDEVSEILHRWIVALFSPVRRATARAESDNRMFDSSLTAREQVQGYQLAALARATEKADLFRDSEVFAETVDLLAQIAPDKLQPPPAYVARPALDAMEYAQDEPELRAMYAKLLATAMDAGKVRTAHPSFVDVIRHLSPDEARIVRLLTPEAGFPIVEMTVRQGDLGYKTLLSNQCLLGKQANCSDDDLVPAYMDNLQRLGLVSITYAEWFSNREAYRELEEAINLPMFQSLGRTAEGHVEVRRGIITVTNLGGRFWLACVPSGDAFVSPGDNSDDKEAKLPKNTTTSP